MYYEGLLLRKVLPEDDLELIMMDSCIDAVRRCFPMHTRELDGEAIRAHATEVLLGGMSEGYVFENPLKDGQLIVFGRLWGAPCWYVLGENKEGTRNVVTVRFHKERTYGDEYAEVEE